MVTGADVGTAVELVASVDDDPTGNEAGVETGIDGGNVVSAVDTIDGTVNPAVVPEARARSADEESAALEQAPARTSNDDATATERRREESLLRIDIY